MAVQVGKKGGRQPRATGHLCHLAPSHSQMSNLVVFCNYNLHPPIPAATNGADNRVEGKEKVLRALDMTYTMTNIGSSLAVQTVRHAFRRGIRTEETPSGNSRDQRHEHEKAQGAATHGADNSFCLNNAGIAPDLGGKPFWFACINNRGNVERPSEMELTRRPSVLVETRQSTPILGIRHLSRRRKR